MFFFTETLNVSGPVMDCLDQIQRADGMASEGRKAFSALPALPGCSVVRASGELCFPKSKGKVLQRRGPRPPGHCHLNGDQSRWYLRGYWQLMGRLEETGLHVSGAGLGWRIRSLPCFSPFSPRLEVNDSLTTAICLGWRTDRESNVETVTYTEETSM